MPQLDELMDHKQDHDGLGSQANGDSVIASLFYEQRRLRADLDRLRSHQTESQDRLRSDVLDKGNAVKDPSAEEKGKASEKTGLKPDPDRKDAAQQDQKEDAKKEIQMRAKTMANKRPKLLL